MKHDKKKHHLFGMMNEARLKQKKWHYYRKVFMWEATIKLSYGLKRFIDYFLSLFFIILFSPIFILTSLAIVIEDPGNVIFSQKRVGKDGRLFDFYKFRSMVIGADKMKDQLMDENESKDGVIFKMKDDPRITKIGKIIRHFSIDELPQLFNVLKGDMSLVGPRPPVPKEVAQYTLEDRKRIHVKPGITCFWQVSGRSNIPFQKQVELDLQYIRSQTLKEDLKILFKTIPAVITGEGAY